MGDDFQSIYSFTGSNLELITNFKKSKIKKNTYRNSKELIKITQNFICKNPYQISKNLKSKKRNNYSIKIIYYKESIKEIWSEVEEIIGKEQTLILGRNNKDQLQIPKIKKI